MQGLCSISAHLWAPQKAGLRQPILILSPPFLGSPRIECCARTLDSTFYVVTTLRDKQHGHGHTMHHCCMCTRGGHVVRGENFFFLEKDVVHVVQTPSPPRAPPKGYTYIHTYTNCA